MRLNVRRGARNQQGEKARRRDFGEATDRHEHPGEHLKRFHRSIPAQECSAKPSGIFERAWLFRGAI
jgi:hypothetical protein